jgi:hypothetical protein
VFGVDGKLPAIVHTQDMDDRASPMGEVSEVMRMDRPVELNHAFLEEATMNDDAEVPIWLWNTQLKTQTWTFFEGREWETDLVVIINFCMSFWRRKVTCSFFTWFYKCYPGHPSHVTVATRNVVEARYTCSADLRKRY